MDTQLLSGSQDWNPSLPGFPRDGRTQLGVQCMVCIPGRGTCFPHPLFCVPWGGSEVSTQQGHRGSSPGLPVSLLSGPGCTHLGGRVEPSERKVFKHHGLCSQEWPKEIGLG